LGGAEARTLNILTDSTDFFRELVESANNNQGRSVNKELESYVVILLREYLNAANLYGDEKEEKNKNSTLFERFAAALESETLESRIRNFRQMGDFTLYISGFFSPSLNSKIVNSSYYIKMGEAAYNQAGSLAKPQQNRKLFIELSLKFIPLVNILTEVSDMAGFRTPQTLLSLYEDWLVTGNEKAQEELEKEGVFPIPLKNFKEQ